MCELLVAKGIIPALVFSRLPTGHGHGEEDGGFGRIKVALRGMTLPTWDSFKTELEAKFKGTKLGVNVVDIHVINDWTKYLKGCFDEKIANLHKLSNTQHQWKFTKVDVSAMFPFGVKTQYRAYCAGKFQCLVC